jgi:hypothetical protein
MVRMLAISCQHRVADYLGLLAFTRILGMDPQEAEKLCVDTTAATKDKSIHSYFPQ